MRSGENSLLFYFYLKLGVKVCVYCNSQHVILLKASKKARLQADHNLPKSDYPCFAVSLSNLYPSCNNCNHLKSDKDLNYLLYYSNEPKNDLKFRLSTKEITLFQTNKIKENDLTINFDQGDSKLNDVLCIDEIYENHIDYAADLIRKHTIYTDSYISKLTSSFKGVFGNNEAMLNQMIFGTTLKEKDINQRVFSKLVFDLKKRLEHLDQNK